MRSWFEERGVDHADDMTQILLTSLARRLRGEAIRLDEQIAASREYHRAIEENGEWVEDRSDGD